MELNTCWRVYTTLHKMLTKRGYLCPDPIYHTLEEFKSKCDYSRQAFIVDHKDDDNNKIMVYFLNPSVRPGERKTIGVDEMRDLLSTMDQVGMLHAITVADAPWSSGAQKEITSRTNCQYHIEFFTTRQLMIDITCHALVPEHIPLTDKEKIAFLKEFSLNESQLPKLMIDDPVARYFGLQKGAVVKIIRASETAGRCTTYRVVV